MIHERPVSLMLSLVCSRMNVQKTKLLSNLILISSNMFFFKLQVNLVLLLNMNQSMSKVN